VVTESWRARTRGVCPPRAKDGRATVAVQGHDRAYRPARHTNKAIQKVVHDYVRRSPAERSANAARSQ
jgi:hypothetical protein